MKQILILMGMSASGKDTICARFKNLGYVPLISATDRPMRDGEKEGVEYYFKTKNEFDYLIENNELIEYREYHTLVDDIPDVWRYGLPKNKLEENKKYIVILDVNGAKDVINYYGKDICQAYYLFSPDAIRKKRCVERGDFNKYEWERRQKADNIAFACDKIESVNGKTIVNWNTEIEELVKEIKDDFEL